MSELIRDLLRSDERYSAIGLEDHLAVRVEQQGTDAVKVIPVQLVDISTTGAKMYCDTAIQPKEQLAVQIESDQLQNPIVVSAEVCWTTPASNGKFCLGFAFKPAIPDEVLRQMASAGLLERRRHMRERISIRTVARWELSKEETPAWLLNYSEGGCCLLCITPGHPGNRVRLTLTEGDQEIHVTVKGQWQVLTEEGYVIGCEFIDGKVLQILERMQEAAAPQNKPLWRRLLGR